MEPTATSSDARRSITRNNCTEHPAAIFASILCGECRAVLVDGGKTCWIMDARKGGTSAEFELVVTPAVGEVSSKLAFIRRRRPFREQPLLPGYAQTQLTCASCGLIDSIWRFDQIGPFADLKHSDNPNYFEHHLPHYKLTDQGRVAAVLSGKGQGLAEGDFYYFDAMNPEIVQNADSGDFEFVFSLLEVSGSAVAAVRVLACALLEEHSQPVLYGFAVDEVRVQVDKTDALAAGQTHRLEADALLLSATGNGQQASAGVAAATDAALLWQRSQSDCLDFLDNTKFCSRDKTCGRRHNESLRRLIEDWKAAGELAQTTMPNTLNRWKDNLKPCPDWCNAGVCPRGISCVWLHPQIDGPIIPPVVYAPADLHIFWNTENVRLPTAGPEGTALVGSPYTPSPKMMLLSLREMLCAMCGAAPDTNLSLIHVQAFYSRNLKQKEKDGLIAANGADGICKVEVIDCGPKANSVDRKMTDAMTAFLSETLLTSASRDPRRSISSIEPQRKKVVVALTSDSDFAGILKNLREFAGLLSTLPIVIVYGPRSSSVAGPMAKPDFKALDVTVGGRAGPLEGYSFSWPGHATHTTQLAAHRHDAEVRQSDVAAGGAGAHASGGESHQGLGASEDTVLHEADEDLTATGDSRVTTRPAAAAAAATTAAPQSAASRAAVQLSQEVERLLGRPNNAVDYDKLAVMVADVISLRGLGIFQIGDAGADAAMQQLPSLSQPPPRAPQPPAMALQPPAMPPQPWAAAGTHHYTHDDHILWVWRLAMADQRYRRPPHPPTHPQYRTKPCKYFRAFGAGGFCILGDACDFCHGN